MIHTKIVLLGKRESLGHVDVYVNGGKNQPTCHPFNYMCSHSKSYEIDADADKHRFFCLDRIRST